MAEGIFRHLAQKPEWKDKIGRIDSCGTAAYHTGDSPDDRTMATLEENGITDYHHSARRRVQATSTQSSRHVLKFPFLFLQFATSDFEKFDYIFAMDRSNLSDLVRLQRGNPDAKARVMLFGEYSGAGKAEIVNDPYYGGDAGFKRAFEQCTRFSQNFLAEMVDGGGEKTASL
ncbi:low molecular weight phosphotyrosine protein phosphatase [Beauveria brongniartii RCEF 3172]|uniref:protein-tyrosine-phosphatase n=1 Tax=Beauveria brongniartii RCEF 3172 TaxID=1081107 RepID=A0A167JWZ1_9HYPO|nr:low molecular weight phosphotyrosine protein phosphatase [Beauveria brongniartii RCEF 3172]